MLRLLFTNEDNSSQLTVITDGIDGQQNILVTEDPIGDTKRYESLGIAISTGSTYNIGTFKEIAMTNSLRLISYPEGLNEEAEVLVEIENEPVVTYEYTFHITPDTVSMKAEGGTYSMIASSTVQKYKNGVEDGDPEQVPFKALPVEESWLSLEGSSSLDIKAEPNTGDPRRGFVRYEQEGGSTKTALITVNQEGPTA